MNKYRKTPRPCAADSSADQDADAADPAARGAAGSEPARDRPAVAARAEGAQPALALDAASTVAPIDHREAQRANAIQLNFDKRT